MSNERMKSLPPTINSGHKITAEPPSGPDAKGGES
jgi:hypothetical protein